MELCSVEYTSMGAQLPRPIFVGSQPFDARCAMLGVQLKKIGAVKLQMGGWDCKVEVGRVVVCGPKNCGEFILERKTKKLQRSNITTILCGKGVMIG